ncbi:LAME_0F16952g1_1 [Lachancea meyersii CBS 8951]|uniref:LAME_0F16952g1_1 n=1 Tax=Lachancea meyersii CBS 8951 TaxID=1266667 RepID=A0A1G4JZU2_9SACH|nr:LAME_0F16952g1_1 [Lachancea meyersii CBS 8951]
MTEYTFRWPQGPNDVLITGDFDNWSGSLPLVKSPRGDFAITMPIPQTSSDKFHFKFIVDGQWQTSNEFKTETSPEGIENNCLIVSSIAAAKAAASSPSGGATGSKIPEIGLNLVAPEVAAPVLGTQAPQKAQPAPGSNKKSKKKKIQIKRRIRRNKKTGERTVLSEERSEVKSGTDTDTYETEETATATATSREQTPLSAEIVPIVGETNRENGFQSTVMPSQENQQTTLGEPGIVILPNAAEIKEFSEIRDVDGDELNERLNRELAAKDTVAEEVAEPEVAVVERDTAQPIGLDKEAAHAEPEFPVKEKDLSALIFPVVAKDETEPEGPMQEKDANVAVVRVMAPTGFESKTADVGTVPPVPTHVDSKQEASETEPALIAAEPVDTQNDALPIVEKVSPLKEAGLPEAEKDASIKTVQNFDIMEQSQLETELPTENTAVAQEHVISEKVIKDEISQAVAESPVDGSYAAEAPTDVDIVVVEGELDELPSRKAAVEEPPAFAEAPASEEEPIGVVKGVPEPSDLVGKETEDNFEAIGQGLKKEEEEGAVISEQIGVITSPEQEAELIKKTLDPKHGKPGETTELLVVDGDIPPSQVAEYQKASEEAAAHAMLTQTPEEVAIQQEPAVVQQESVAKEPVKPTKAPSPKQNPTPATPEKKKKKKGLFSKIKKIFH